MTAVPTGTHPHSGSQPLRVIVVGGGLAGMAAAVALESAGVSVTLIEPRQRLGGRASSFDEPRSGEELDNCQHVLLGCCTNLRDFYRRLGVADRIGYSRTICFRDTGGRQYQLLGLRRVPAPLHLGPSFIGFGALNWLERVSVARSMLAMLRLGGGEMAALADVPFGQWLDEHRQPPRLVRKFYDPILIGALNESTRDASAAYAIQVFRQSLLANDGGYVLGLPTCPLGQLYERLPCRDVRLGMRVTELRFADGAMAGVRLQDGQWLTADAYVLATNYHTIQKWASPEIAQRDARFASLDKLQSVPILGAHLWFDRGIMPQTHAALLSGPLQWLFRKDRAGCALHGVISAARDWVDVPREQCLRLFERQIRTIFPAAAGAKLLRGVIVIEKRATFSPVPGVDRHRPRQAPPAGGIGNLFLAGDYTQTGWPATMEGAVRSGYLAADAVLAGNSGGERKSLLVPDLPVQWPARLLGFAR